jgi:beta-galactosidase/beta-glucuronidase
LSLPQPGPRSLFDLAGLWDFRFEGPTARLEGAGRQIRVPGIWQTQFRELRNAPGTGFYRRRIQIPETWAGLNIVLVMEGVFHEATVLIDERPIATNGNGWTEFEIDLTTFLNGVETLALGVDAHVPDDRFSERRGFSQTLAGKQDWYGLQGGIWRAARLEARKALHLKTIAVQTSTDLESHHVKVRGSDPSRRLHRFASRLCAWERSFRNRNIR